MEDCLVVECGADWQDIIAHRRGNIAGESFSGVESKGGRLHTFRYNIVADNAQRAVVRLPHGRRPRHRQRLLGQPRTRLLQRVRRQRHAVHRKLLPQQRAVQQLVHAAERAGQLLPGLPGDLAQPRPLADAEQLHDHARKRHDRPAAAVPDALLRRLGTHAVPRELPQLPGGFQPRAPAEGRPADRRRRQEGPHARGSPQGVRLGAARRLRRVRQGQERPDARVAWAAAR